MSNRLYCEAADVFRGVAPMNGNLASSIDCQPARPISWVSFCGTRDGVCNSGQEANFEKVAALNGCTGDPHETYVTPTTSCKAYTAARLLSPFSPPPRSRVAQIDRRRIHWRGFADEEV